MNGPVFLTYSFAPDFIFDANPSNQDPPFVLLDAGGATVGNNTLFATLDAQYGEGLPETDPLNLGGREAWRLTVVNAIESWEEVAGISLVQTFRSTTSPGIPEDDTGTNFCRGCDSHRQRQLWRH